MPLMSNQNPWCLELKMKRESYFSGSFYPSEKDEINRYIEHFEKISSAHFDTHMWQDKKIPAIVVPHAGYVYSGFTAHLAYRLLQLQAPKTVVVLGPSHHHYFKGMSLAMQDTYETPLGSLDMDRELVNTLKEKFALSFDPKAHKEHSTEVQMPLIKHYLPQTKVIELVYSDINGKEIEPILEYLVEREDLMIVISTDLSHFYTLQEAKVLDSICLDAFKKLNPKRLHEGCEACGILGLEAMMHVASKNGLHSEVLDYRTSADASDDKESVVGYMSGIFEQKG